MMHPSRRAVIFSSIAAVAASGMSRLAYASAATPKRLVFVIQRGAADGLAILAPTGDPSYHDLRGSLAEGPSGTKLDGMFTLHPSLVNSARLYNTKQANFAHAVSTVYRDRSHFDGQNVLEGGGAQPYGREDGWMGRLLTMLPSVERDSVAIAPAVPLALRGRMPVGTFLPNRMPEPDNDLIERLDALYDEDPMLGALWAASIKSREIAGDIGGKNGRNGNELGQLAAALMLPADGARIVMLETGGWDTHRNQMRQLTLQLAGLDQLVGALQKGLGSAWQNTLVIVATEFGRTAAVNGTGGTDHGTASMAMLFGGGLPKGGLVSADWPGLSARNLQDGRDLRPTRSLETVISAAVAAHYEIDFAKVAKTLYPQL